MSAEARTVRIEVNDRAGGPKSRVVREAPTPNALIPTEASAAYPDVPDEPVLRISEIQGNIVGGFNKDFQTLIFLRIDDATTFKPWLARFADVVATADEVIAFNRLFKSTRRRRRYSGSVRATWINIAFSHAGLVKLTGDADRFTDASFRSGMVARSEALGDPTAADAEGNPRLWLVHDGERGVDVLVIVASDTLADLEAEVAQVEQSIFAPRRDGLPVRSGVSIVFKEEGRTQPGALAGHEHFGFLDGVSQPGLRGRLSEAHHDVLTPRQNPDERRIRASPARTSSGPANSSSAIKGRTLLEFDGATFATQRAPEADQCKDVTYWQSPGDPTGDRCPFAGHIRKSYARDDSPPGESETQTHRLLRRGIPFGPSSRSTPEVPVKDDIDRGLLFMAYMTSITDQFEHVTTRFVNDPDFKEANAGVDAILGQVQHKDGGRQRTFNVRVYGVDHPLTAAEDWVIPTGGGYYFAPSISAIKDVLAKPRAARPSR